MLLFSPLYPYLNATRLLRSCGHSGRRPGNRSHPGLSCLHNRSRRGESPSANPNRGSALLTRTAFRYTLPGHIALLKASCLNICGETKETWGMNPERNISAETWEEMHCNLETAFCTACHKLTQYKCIHIYTTVSDYINPQCSDLWGRCKEQSICLFMFCGALGNSVSLHTHVHTLYN